MGGSTYSHTSYTSRAAVRSHVAATKGVAAAAAATFKSGSLHKDLDPRGVVARESRDSAAHPDSNAIIVAFDVTGSMGEIPTKFACEKLGKLMQTLIAQAVIPDPQILFAAVGDATMHDDSPFQFGQFESGLEMDDQLTKIHLEGGGGAGGEESYELAVYAAARHTSIDCYEKRGRKGYLFLLGDERCYPAVDRAQVAAIFGDKLQADVPVKDIVREAQDRYHVFHVSVRTPGYPDGSLGFWKDLLGDHAVFIQSPDDICDFIAAQIAVTEGATVAGAAAKLRASGSAAGTVDAVTKSLVVGAAPTSALVGSAAGLSVAATPRTKRL